MSADVTLSVDKTIGPILPWELPIAFDLWFSRTSNGYWQAWGTVLDASHASPEPAKGRSWIP